MGSIVSKHFVFIHVPKTGGTWLGDILLRESPPEWGVKYVGVPRIHCGASELTKHEGTLPRFGFIRNPWSWYVSLYCFLDDRFRRRMGDFALPLADLDPLWQKWGPIVDSVKPGKEGFREALRIGLSDQPFGDMDLLETSLLDGCSIGTFENLRADSVSLLRACTGGTRLPGSLRAALSDSEPVNQSAPDTLGYYDKETQELVRRLEPRCAGYAAPELATLGEL